LLGEVMGAFISLAFQWRGTLRDMSPLNGALAAAGLKSVRLGECEEKQHASTWLLFLEASGHELTCRSFDAGSYVATTLDIEEAQFDAVSSRIGREQVIDTFVKLGGQLLVALGLRYVFFEEEAEADFDPDTFDGSQLFGIAILPDTAPWLERVLCREDIVRVTRWPGAVAVFRRTDAVPHRG
jgi:hypothetical protein